eukprot:IDg4608t1
MDEQDSGTGKITYFKDVKNKYVDPDDLAGLGFSGAEICCRRMKNVSDIEEKMQQETANCVDSVTGTNIRSRNRDSFHREKSDGRFTFLDKMLAAKYLEISIANAIAARDIAKKVQTKDGYGISAKGDADNDDETDSANGFKKNASIETSSVHESDLD